MALPDERIPVEGQSRCDCFLCGRVVRIGNAGTGTYSSNNRFAPELPIHIDCLNGRDRGMVHVAYMAAIRDADTVVRAEERRQHQRTATTAGSLMPVA